MGWAPLPRRAEASALVARTGLPASRAGRRHPICRLLFGPGRCRQAGTGAPPCPPPANNSTPATQTEARHAVITAASTLEAWVPPLNFLLCLQIKGGNLVDFMQPSPGLSPNAEQNMDPGRPARGFLMQGDVPVGSAEGRSQSPRRRSCLPSSERCPHPRPPDSPLGQGACLAGARRSPS